MLHRFRNQLLALALVSICTSTPSCTAQAMHDDTMMALQKGLLHPPADARPMVRWWWFGVAVTKPEILRELQQMQADGIGGVELAFVYPQELDDPTRGIRNLPFLSPEMLDAVNYAQAEARRLGLRIDVTLCSGWPYGGPATSLEDAAARLRIVELPVPANANFIALPTLAAGESFISASIVQGAPNHWAAASATPLLLPTDTDVKEVTISHSPEKEVAVFFIASHTRQQVKRAAVGAEGYVLDPYSHEAVANHLKKVGEPLMNAFEATPPYAIFSDSFEAYGADWTPTLPAEFRKRRGYDLIPHLPELVSGGTAAAQKVRHDYGRTLTELVDENYLTQINEWAKTHGTRFRSQTYGEPAVSLASQRLVSLPEGEGPQWRAFSTLRWATSANHLFGNNVTSGETYTWLHSPVFRATPLDMKAEADIDFIMGENQLIFHGWPYSPPQIGEPGWSLYAAAVFNDHNPWHPVMPSVTTYIARMSWLLRQGEPANQVALLLPTDRIPLATLKKIAEFQAQGAK
ncbi:MAG TPA: glycosyl hydrolase [Edaphobacter sp.]|nr:glycosyl hydrolase [Edaphobacter sp.]